MDKCPNRQYGLDHLQNLERAFLSFPVYENVFKFNANTEKKFQIFNPVGVVINLLQFYAQTPTETK